MDPLSIATGAASLVVTARALSLRLQNLIKETKNVDSNLNTLSNEVADLTRVLISVESTTIHCHSQNLTLLHLDEQVFISQQLENIMADCKFTLRGLDRLVSKMRSDLSSKNLMKYLRRSSMNLKLNAQMDDISSFMNKIYNLNCALQTALAVVNISLDFQANTSQKKLYRDLKGLKSLVEVSLETCQNAEIRADPYTARLTRQLQAIAKAAQRFHSTVSSIVSIRNEDAGHVSSGSSSSGSDVGYGYLSESQRERIERWNNQLDMVYEGQEDQEDQEDNVSMMPDTGCWIEHSVVTRPDPERSIPKMAKREESESEAYSTELDVALKSLKAFDELKRSRYAFKDYAKAEELIRKAVEQTEKESSSVYVAYAGVNRVAAGRGPRNSFKHSVYV